MFFSFFQAFESRILQAFTCIFCSILVEFLLHFNRVARNWLGGASLKKILWRRGFRVSANWCYLLSFLNLHSLRRFAIARCGIGASGGEFSSSPPPPPPICKRFEIFSGGHLKIIGCSSVEKIFIAFLLTSIQRYSRKKRRILAFWGGNCRVRGKVGVLFKQRKTAEKRLEKRLKRPFLPSTQWDCWKRRICTSTVVLGGWQKQNSPPMGKPLTGHGKSIGRGGGDFYKSFSPAKRKSYP